MILRLFSKIFYFFLLILCTIYVIVNTQIKDINRSPVDINNLKSALSGRKVIFMTAKVLGTRDLDFKANDGNAIRGRQVFVCYKRDHVDGEFVDKVFIQHDSPLASVSFKYGQEYDFVYEVQGFRGKPVLVDIRQDGKSLVPSVMGNF